MLIEVYSDGSATTKDLPGGWAFVLCINSIKVAEGSGHLPKATNNVAELTAAISGLEYISTHDIPGLSEVDGGLTVPTVCLISDSKLVLGFADGSYNCRKPHLLPLMLRLRKVYRALNATNRWERGHQGEPNNERCDELAKAARNAGSEDVGDDKGNSKPNNPIR
jgi:ribonuclease HI